MSSFSMASIVDGSSAVSVTSYVSVFVVSVSFPSFFPSMYEIICWARRWARLPSAVLVSTRRTR